MGSLFLQWGEYGLAQRYNEEAYEFWKKTNFLNERIACLQNLGIIYLRNKEEVKASESVLEALRMAVTLQDETQFAISIEILLEHYEKLERYDMLLELKKKALEFWNQMKSEQRQFKTLIDLGVISQILEDYDSGIIYFRKSFNLAYHSGDLKKMFLAEGFLAECYLKQGDLDKAKNTYKQAFKLAKYLKYIDKNQNSAELQNHVDSMHLALLSLGVSHEEIKEADESAIKEAKQDQPS